MHLVGQTLRPRGAHTKRNGDQVFGFFYLLLICLSISTLSFSLLTIPFFFSCGNTPSGKKSWNTCLICLSNPQSDVHFSNKSGEICTLGTTGWGACLFNFKLVYLLAGGKKNVAGESKQWKAAEHGGVDKGTNTHAHTRTRSYWLRDTKKQPDDLRSSSAAFNLRSLLLLDRACFATRILLLDCDYLYYPITALRSSPPSFIRGHRKSVLSNLSALANLSCPLK